MLLDGLFLPVATPFYPDGRVYLRKLEHNIDRYSRTPAAGMLVPGPDGEGGGLSDVELARILEVALAASAAEKVMIAGVERASVFGTLALADHAGALGYDAIAIACPEFSHDEARLSEILTYFNAVADRSPLPVVVASHGNRQLAPAVLGRLGQHPNIIGAIDDDANSARLRPILDATANVRRQTTVTPVFAAVTGRMLRPAPAAPGSFVSAESLGGGGTALASAPPSTALRTRTRQVGFQVLCGTASQMLDAWNTGAAGAVPRLAACAPQACCEVWQAFRDGDPALAKEKLEEIEAASHLVEGLRGVAALKHGMDFNGYFGGRPRLPLIALTAAEKETVERSLKTLRN